jgi:hypothetical protein
MGYLLLAVVGTGTQSDPLRPLFPVTTPPMTEQLGFRWSAHIPTNPGGTAIFSNCYVWLPDSFVPPVGVIFESTDAARNTIGSRDPKASTRTLEALP